MTSEHERHGKRQKAANPAEQITATANEEIGDQKNTSTDRYDFSSIMITYLNCNHQINEAAIFNH